MTSLLIGLIAILLILLIMTANVAVFYAERENKRAQEQADLNAKRLFEAIERGS